MARVRDYSSMCEPYQLVIPAQMMKLGSCIRYRYTTCTQVCNATNPLLTVCEVWDIKTHGYHLLLVLPWLPFVACVAMVTICCLCCHGYHLLLVLPWLPFAACVATGPDQALFRVQRRTHQPPG